jgi:hypothetical protein
VHIQRYRVLGAGVGRDAVHAFRNSITEGKSRIWATNRTLPREEGCFQRTCSADPLSAVRPTFVGEMRAAGANATAGVSDPAADAGGGVAACPARLDQDQPASRACWKVGLSSTTDGSVGASGESGDDPTALRTMSSHGKRRAHGRVSEHVGAR